MMRELYRHEVLPFPATLVYVASSTLVLVALCTHAFQPRSWLWDCAFVADYMRSGCTLLWARGAFERHWLVRVRRSFVIAAHAEGISVHADARSWPSAQVRGVGVEERLRNGRLQSRILLLFGDCLLLVRDGVGAKQCAAECDRLRDILGLTQPACVVAVPSRLRYAVGWTAARGLVGGAGLLFATSGHGLAAALCVFALLTALDGVPVLAARRMRPQARLRDAPSGLSGS